MLDLDHGTYPFVTSSNPVAGAACVGAGVGPRDIDEVWGVAKAYATRVGAGPFPTELDDDVGAACCSSAATSSAPPRAAQRRCGWIDLVALRYAVRLNGMTALVITKLDVLAGIDPLARRGPLPLTARARSSTSSPTTSRSSTRPRPSTRSCPASRATSATAAPRRTCRRRPATTSTFISDFVGVPVSLVGVGPGRDQVVWMGKEAEPRAPRRRLSRPSCSEPTSAWASVSASRPRDQPLLARLAPLAAAQHAQREDRRREDRGEAEAELDASDALAGPVDVAQVEQQRRLVEGEAHAGAHRRRRAAPRAVSLSVSERRRPRSRRRSGSRARSGGCGGRRRWTLPNGHQPPRIPQVERRIEGERAEEPGEHVEQDRLVRGRRLVALDGDADRVDARRPAPRRSGRRRAARRARSAPQHAARTGRAITAAAPVTVATGERRRSTRVRAARALRDWRRESVARARSPARAIGSQSRTRFSASMPAGDAAEVEHQRRLGDDLLVVDLGVGGDDRRPGRRPRARASRSTELQVRARSARARGGRGRRPRRRARAAGG